MTLRRRLVPAVGVVALLLWNSPSGAQAPAPGGSAYEVWVVDQSDTRGLDHGGTLYIFAGADLQGKSAAAAKPAAVVDLGGAAAALCREKTGAAPVRPHMVLFNRGHTH